MQNFIVLGIIPGTNIQTTFTFWLLVTLGAVSLLAARSLVRRRHAVHAYILGLKIARFIDQYQLPA